MSENGGLRPLTDMSTRSRGNQTFEIVDRLHAGHVTRVSGERIAATVSNWLAELGIDTPMAQELGLAAMAGQWQRVHALEDVLSIDVVAAD